MTLGSATSTGTIVLSGANSYGGTTINAPNTVQINTGGSLGTGNVINNGALIFNSSGTPSVSSVISGLGSITKGGSGTVALNGNNSYSGATTINTGAIQAGNGNALGFGGTNVGINSPFAVATVNSSGTIDLNGQTLNKPITLDGGTLTNSNGSTAGILAGVSGYTVTSAGSGVAADLAHVIQQPHCAQLRVRASSFSWGHQRDDHFGYRWNRYTTAPTVTVTGVGGGNGATAVAMSPAGRSRGFTITSPGSGYFHHSDF